MTFEGVVGKAGRIVTLIWRQIHIRLWYTMDLK